MLHAPSGWTRAAVVSVTVLAALALCGPAGRAAQTASRSVPRADDAPALLETTEVVLTTTLGGGVREVR